MGGALDGITILDFTRFQQGTFATLLLGDMGANVLKVEQPGGDPGRGFTPFTDGYSGYFESLNRNKRSIVIDLRKPEGRDVILRLAERADAAVENFRPGVMDRLGLGYAALRARNPRIIYASASMYGSRGTRATHPGYDNIAQAAGGMMMATRHGEEVPYSPQPGLADQVGGMMLSHGILAALLARERTGTSQRIDSSLYGSQIALQGIHLTRALYDAPREPPGVGASVFSHRAFCADAVWIAFGYLTADFWPKMCRALELDWLITDPRFAEPDGRGRHQHELVECIDAQVALRPSAEWIERLIEAGVPCSVVQDYHMVGEDPQALANDYVITYEHPLHGPVRAQGFQTSMSETPPALRYPAPHQPGLHSQEILCEAGFGPEEIQTLLASGAVQQGNASREAYDGSVMSSR